MALLFYLKKKQRKTGKMQIQKGKRAQSNRCIRDLHSPLGLKVGNKEELFLALCQEDISLTGTRVGTR